MRRIALLAAVVVLGLIMPTAAFGYTFGNWASENGYSSGAVMPDAVYA